jgi:hypothetical protein
MKTPHKHAELIKAWADGAEIQYHKGHEWCDVVDNTPYWYECNEYRIKPEPKKYRVALFIFNDGSHRTESTSCEHTASNWEKDYRYFVRWLTDWTEYSL